MQIKILRQCATPYGPFEEGQVAEIPDDDAQKWVKSGLAESVTDVTHNVTQDKPVTNTGSVTKKDVTPVTKKDVTPGKEEKKRKQTADRVQRYRAKGKMITIRHTSGKVETLPGDQAMKLVQEGKAELVGETAMTNPPEVR